MITSVSIQHKTSKRNQSNQLELAYTKLNQFIDKVDLKIANRIQLVEQIYLDDYKQQVSIMANQLKKIRSVMDEQLIKQKSNQRLFFLQQQRDFFRAQVIKLNEDLGKVLAENSNLKVQLAEKKQQIANFKKITYGLQTKIFKIKNQALQTDKIKNQEKQSSIKLQPLKTSRNKQTQATTLNLFNKTDKTRPSKSMRTFYSKPVLPPYFEQSIQRQEIVDACIKQVKKQIYYRNLNLGEASKIHFNENGRVPFSKFTKTDKKDLILKILSDPKILDQFYDYLFERKKIANPQKVQQLKTRIVDDRYNKKTLTSVKKQFNKKIFDIKSNI